jgi:predicted glycosyltransferase
MAAPRVLIYVQHLLGVGHLHRVATIARAMRRGGCTTMLVSGGLPDPTLHGLDGIDFIQLPPARAKDAAFKILLDETDSEVTDAWKAMRSRKLQATVTAFSPDAILTELFPFGRRQMRFELLPLLDKLHRQPRRPLIFCSVRDILVDRSKPQHDLDTLSWLQTYYDGVLVHGDPAIVPFEQTFPPASKIRDKLYYTGYIAERHAVAATDAGAGEVLVSAGGGAVGMALFDAALAARPLSLAHAAPWRLLVSAQEDAGAIAALQHRAGPDVIIEPVRPDFPGMLRHCLLSISKAGYNTVMETLGSGARAVVVPFAGGRETEQTLRAELLAQRGLLQILSEQDTSPETLARAIDRALTAPRPDPRAIRLDGAEDTARRVRELVEARP